MATHVAHNAVTQMTAEQFPSHETTGDVVAQACHRPPVPALTMQAGRSHFGWLQQRRPQQDASYRCEQRQSPAESRLGHRCNPGSTTDASALQLLPTVAGCVCAIRNPDLRTCECLHKVRRANSPGCDSSLRRCRLLAAGRQRRAPSAGFGMRRSPVSSSQHHKKKRETGQHRRKRQLFELLQISTAREPSGAPSISPIHETMLTLPTRPVTRKHLVEAPAVHRLR
jgi:hypothetical protein